MRLFAYVAGYLDGLLAGLLDDPGRLLGVRFLLIEVGDQDVCPLAGEGEGNRPPDAGVPTGYDRRLTFQTPVATIRIVPVVGLRLHLGIKAGVFLLLFGELWLWVLLLRILLPGLVVGHLYHLFPCAPRGTPDVFGLACKQSSLSFPCRDVAIVQLRPGYGLLLGFTLNK